MRATRRSAQPIPDGTPGAPWRRPSLLAGAVALAVTLAPAGSGAGQGSDPSPADGPESMLVLDELWRSTEAIYTGDPVLSGDDVVVSGSDGALHALDASTGEARWSVPSDDGPALSFEPALVGTLVVALEHEEGAETARVTGFEMVGESPVERWSVPFDVLSELPYGTPVATSDGGILVELFREEDAARPQGEQGRSHGYVVLDPDDGSERFRMLFTQCEAVGGEIVVSPMDTFLGGADTPRGITARDARSGAERWFLGEQVDGCPLVTEDTVYLDPYDVEAHAAIDAMTGALRWAMPAPSGDEQLLAVEDTLYVTRVVEGLDGQRDAQRVVAIDGRDGSTRWESGPVPGEIATAALDGDRLVLGTADVDELVHGGLVVLDASTGNELGFVDRATDGVAVVGDRIASSTWDPDADDRGTLRMHTTREVPVVTDLPAMVLTAEDLDAVGLPGFGIGSGGTKTGAEFIEDTATTRSLSSDEVALLEAAHPSRRYDLTLSRPSDTADPASAAAVIVGTYAVEYADAAGASAAWELLEDESGNDAARDLDEHRDLGDVSEITVEEGEDPANGARYALADLTIRRGAMHLGVAMIDWSGGTPDPLALRALGERLVERADTARAHPTRALGSRLLRLTGPGSTLVLDRFTVWDSRPQAQAGQPITEPEDPNVATLMRMPLETFELQLHLARSEGDSWISTGGDRYRSREAALDALVDAREALEFSDGLLDLTLEDLPELGEGAFASSYRSPSGLRYVGVHVAADTRTSLVEWVGAMDEPDAPAGVRELADRALTCLVEGCLEPQPIPDDLTE
ncbi:MAG: PQQ-binding-like beta-propeller repeat protein [Candidatus Limnocylindrales bacterium]